MKASVSAQTLVNFWHTTQRYPEEYGIVHAYGHDSRYRYNIIIDRPLNPDGGQSGGVVNVVNPTSCVREVRETTIHLRDSVSKLSLSFSAINVRYFSLVSNTHRSNLNSFVAGSQGSKVKFWKAVQQKL